MLKKIRGQIAKLTELPKEVILNLPLIAITGNKSLTIENYKGILEYDEEAIRISTASGIIKVTGRKLILNEINTEAIQITGFILSVEFPR